MRFLHPSSASLLRASRKKMAVHHCSIRTSIDSLTFQTARPLSRTSFFLDKVHHDGKVSQSESDKEKKKSSSWRQKRLNQSPNNTVAPKCGDGRARSIVLALEIHICWNVLKKKQDRPSNRYRVLSLAEQQPTSSSWVEPTPSILSSCAPQSSLGTSHAD